MEYTGKEASQYTSVLEHIQWIKNIGRTTLHLLDLDWVTLETKYFFFRRPLFVADYRS